MGLEIGGRRLEVEEFLVRGVSIQVERVGRRCSRSLGSEGSRRSGCAISTTNHKPRTFSRSSTDHGQQTAHNDTMSPERTLLIENIHRAFDRRSWHGPNLMGAIRGMKPEEAAWRPQPERHNAWELIVHAAYWKYRVIRRLDDSVTDAFTFTGSNFFARPVEPTAAALKADVQVLRDWHGRLLEVVEAIDPASLDAPAGSEWNRRETILGIAAHDAYHAGQIRLLRRMWKEVR